MKRLIGTVLLIVPLVLGIASCQKAHKAGNDSMSVGGARIEASVSPGAINAMPAAGR
ncbi:hypothetical protein [Paraburkholderia sp.]|jgi:hypothetical protein|uniref:hypothetical protein n=1 Tax=Paraburkholderia sp. TaxID=1926495 RepID=UPI002F3F22B3